MIPPKDFVRLESWIGEVKVWRSGLGLDGVKVLYFLYEGNGYVRFVDLGLPNAVEAPWSQPCFAPVASFVDPGPYELHTGSSYAAFGFQWAPGDIVRLLPPGPESAVVQLHDRPMEQWKCAEGFAGLGAWTVAAQQLGMKISSAVEIDAAVAHVFQVNHPQVQVITADIGDPTHWAMCPTDVWFLSPPCPAFSKMGTGGGLASAQATGWLSLATMVRVTRPCALIVECVEGITTHLPSVKELLRLCGYVLKFQKVVDLSAFSPGRRTRWFGIFLRKDIKTSAPPFSPVLPTNTDNLCSFQAVQPSSWSWSDLMIPEEAWDMLKDPAFVRGATTSEQALKKHVVTKEQILPTVQHRYGFNFDLPFLKERGLHSPILFLGDESAHDLRSSRDLYRFFGPWEVARVHLLPKDLILPASTREAWQLLGNGISTAQCLAPLVALESMFRPGVGQDRFDIALEGILSKTISFPRFQPEVIGRWQTLQPMPLQDIPLADSQEDAVSAPEPLPGSAVPCSLSPLTSWGDQPHIPMSSMKLTPVSSGLEIRSDDSARCFGILPSSPSMHLTEPKPFVLRGLRLFRALYEVPCTLRELHPP